MLPLAVKLIHPGALQEAVLGEKQGFCPDEEEKRLIQRISDVNIKKARLHI